MGRKRTKRRRKGMLKSQMTLRIWPKCMRNKADQELRVGFVEPVLHYVMGGIAIDPESRALDQEDKVIPGLFSCGEAAGGVHGRNRLAGNSLVECVVYGRVSGDSAVKYMSGTRS